MMSLQDLVATSGGPCTRPDSIVSLMEIIEDPLVGADTLLPVVEKDPGLTAGLLKLCNSPLYGFKRRIGTPREALVLVGNLTFARLCFTLSLEPVLHRNLPGYDLDLDHLWQHCLATAYGAAFLMKVSGFREQQDRAFTAGLLHDIGKLVLDRALAEEGQEEEDFRMTREIEIARTGHDHAEAGAALLESWDLPGQIVEAVGCHHDPAAASAGAKLPAAVHMADKVAHVSLRLRAGSKALAEWVESACSDGSFGSHPLACLADEVAAAHHNIMSLAVGPSL